MWHFAEAGRQAFSGKSAACKLVDPSCRFFCLAEFLLFCFFASNAHEATLGSRVALKSG